MGNDRAIRDLRMRLRQLRERGYEQISIDLLCEILLVAEESSAEEPADPFALAQFEARLQAANLRIQAAQAQSIEFFRSIVASGQSAIQTSILINGGAAVAILAFIGNVAKQAPAAAADLADAVVRFAAGVLAAALGSGITYAGQYGFGFGWQRAAVIFNVLAVVAVVAAYVLFGWGVKSAFDAFVQLAPG
jgi:hypothetical protein